ncbi:MAG: hypothetical protein MZV70_37880 [Desulfobacterales bacterium]|nr:hypothetical protein [Desulfobacterales bacterium]
MGYYIGDQSMLLNLKEAVNVLSARKKETQRSVKTNKQGELTFEKHSSSVIATGKARWWNSVQRSRKPNVRDWLPLATRLDTKRAAAFSALLLSNLVENKPGFRVSVNALYEIYRAMNVEGGAKNSEEWLRTGW